MEQCQDEGCRRTELSEPHENGDGALDPAALDQLRHGLLRAQKVQENDGPAGGDGSATAPVARVAWTISA